MAAKNNKIEFQNWQTIDYQEAWKKQTQIFEHVLAQKALNRNREEQGLEPLPTSNYLIFCQHPHTFTIGKSGNFAHLLLDSRMLQAIEAQFVPTNRGGDITYHGPGQIVGYPILDLDNFFTDIHRYMRTLEQAVIQTLAHWQIEAGRIEGLTGVWIEPDVPHKARKICALGVKTSRWVTMHGFAFNVRVDLSYFKHIVPCGIADKAVTSMDRELGYQPDIQEVAYVLKVMLADVFQAQIIETPAKQSLKTTSISEP